MRPYLNKIYLAQGDIEEGICSTEFFVLKPSEEINPLFLQTFLLSSFVLNQTKHMMTGNTLPRVIREDVCNIKIPLLPHPIQDRVAEIMEEAYKQRKEKLKEAEDLLAEINDYVLDKLDLEIPEIGEKKTFVITLKELKEGKRHDPFYCLPRFKELIKQLEGRDDILPLKEITSTIMSGQRPKGGVRNIGNGVPSLGGEHVNADGTIKTEDLKYIPLDFHKKYSKTSIENFDLLLFMPPPVTFNLFFQF